MISPRLEQRPRAWTASASTPGVDSSYSELNSCRRRPTSAGVPGGGAADLDGLRSGPSRSVDQALEAEGEGFQGELLGDVEVEAAAGVLDELGGAAGGGGLEPLGGGPQLGRGGRG